MDERPVRVNNRNRLGGQECDPLNKKSHCAKNELHRRWLDERSFAAEKDGREFQCGVDLVGAVNGLEMHSHRFLGDA